VPNPSNYEAKLFENGRSTTDNNREARDVTTDAELDLAFERAKLHDNDPLAGTVEHIQKLNLLIVGLTNGRRPSKIYRVWRRRGTGNSEITNYHAPVLASTPLLSFPHELKLVEHEKGTGDEASERYEMVPVQTVAEIEDAKNPEDCKSDDLLNDF
jgi:hypothetical protein